MNVLESWPLGKCHTLCRVDEFSEETYQGLFDRHMIAGHPILPWRSTLPSTMKEKQHVLKRRLEGKFQLKLGLFKEQELVGWTHGCQDSVHDGDFYMGSSLVLPEHQGQGLYTGMAKKVMEITRLEGFTAVRSRHVCTNNAILIAKLKLGFTINGFEQDETMGTLVRMIYHHDDLRRRSQSFRAGRLTEEGIMELLLASLPKQKGIHESL